MTTQGNTNSMEAESSLLRGRFISAYYLLTIATGAFILFFHGRLAFAADIAVGTVYLVVTAFLYGQCAGGRRRKREQKENL